MHQKRPAFRRVEAVILNFVRGCLLNEPTNASRSLGYVRNDTDESCNTPRHPEDLLRLHIPPLKIAPPHD